jgi:hypothetical protein
MQMVGAQQQLRGMKVRSAIKKRCEHCKVRFFLGWGGVSCPFIATHWILVIWLTNVVVRTDCETEGRQET